MISVRDMKIAEDNAMVQGITKATLMENAGKAFVKEFRKRFSLKGKKILVMCYHGNNGGDGFVIARYLSKLCDVTVLFLGNEKKFSPQTKENFAKLCDINLIRELTPEEKKKKYSFIIDALLGTGAVGMLKEPLKSAVQFANASKAKIISVDVPTGVDPQTGLESNPRVKQALTITFHDKKPGLSGPVSVVDIGIPSSDEVGPGEVRAALGSNPVQAKKGDFGKVLVIGGSEDFAGAPALSLSALSALRGGCDLVKVCAPEKVAWAINSFTPDVISKKLFGTHITRKHLPVIKKEMEWADVILLGPGLGLDKETISVVRQIVKNPKPKVIDADALKMINFKIENAILTPHRGEFKIIWENNLKAKTPALTKKGIEQLQKILDTNVMLVKAPVDLIISSDAVKKNKTGHSGMTVGGTGDVLAGLVAGILAQSGNLFLSASAAAWISGKAGEECSKEMHRSYLASDVVKKIPLVINDVFKHD